MKNWHCPKNTMVGCSKVALPLIRIKMDPGHNIFLDNHVVWRTGLIRMIELQVAHPGEFINHYKQGARSLPQVKTYKNAQKHRKKKLL